MRQRPLMSFLAATVVMLLLISSAGCNASRNPLSIDTFGTTELPGAAIFVSKNAPVMVSMLQNPDHLPALPRNEELSKLKTSLLANTDIDYQQDIQPWLGKEVTLAVSTLDIDRNPENGRQPGYLIALSVQQPEKSREFVELFFSKRALAGATLTVEYYKGVKLIYDNQQEFSPREKSASSPNSIAGAVVGDRFILFANHPKVLREAINNVQAAELNLTSSSQYQQASKQLPKEALALTFLNLPIVADWQELNLISRTYDSQILSLVSKPKGLFLETTFTATEDLTSSAQLSKPVGALQYIPNSAAIAVAGTNLSSLGNSDLAQLWLQVTAAISGSQEDVISRLAEPMAAWQQSSKINWKKDIFSWVDGEYAIGLLPSKEQTTPEWVFVAEKSEATPAGIAHLDEIASSNGLSLNSINLDTQKITAWTELTTTKTDFNDRQSFAIQAKVNGVRTTVGNYEIFTSSIETMDEVLKTMDNSIINNRNFQDSIAAIPQPNQGYVYLDWTKSQPILESEFPILKLLKIVGKPFFHNLRSLTVSSYGSETRLLKGGVFLTTE